MVDQLMTKDNMLYQIAEYSDLYKRWLIDQLKEMSMYAEQLRMSYMIGEENRNVHNALISISCELWMHLLPKLKTTPFYDDFKKWMIFYVEPRLFLVDKYAHLIFEFTFVIRMGYEHIGITRIYGGI